MNALITVQESNLIESPRDLIAPFVASLDLRERSKQSYSKNISYYFDWLEASGRKGGDRADILAYKDYLKARYEASTISAYLSSVRSFYSWLEASGLYSNVANGIKGAKKPVGFRKDPLTVDQVKAVLSGIDRGTLEGLRDYALVNLLIHTGLRTIEVQRADTSDIRQVGGKLVLFVQGKGHDEKDAFVILTPSVYKSIMDYLEARHVKVSSDSPLFASISNRNVQGRLTTRSMSRIVKEALMRAGINSDRITAHSMRHTAVTLALIGGASIQEAQSMARHTNINTTMIYAHNLDRLDSPAESKIEALLGI